MFTVTDVVKAQTWGVYPPKKFSHGGSNQYFCGDTFRLESLILKQIDLYCKNILTHVFHIDLTLL